MPKRGYVSLKVGNMRKPEDFCVFPRPTNVGPEYSTITMKSDHRHIEFDANTGKGLLSVYAKDYPSLMKGVAAAVVVPTDVIEAAKEQMPKPGDRIGGILVIA